MSMRKQLRTHTTHDARNDPTVGVGVDKNCWYIFCYTKVTLEKGAWNTRVLLLQNDETNSAVRNDER